MAQRKGVEGWPQRVWWTLCGLLALATVGANIAGKLKTALIRHGIIPEIMSQAPRLGMHLAYGKRYTARFGNYIPIDLIQTRPTTVKWICQDNAVYTMISMDLDTVQAKDRYHDPEFQRLLWLVGNVPAGNMSSQVNVTLGTQLAAYIGPTLRNASAEHRVLFLVFEQPAGLKLNFTEEILEANPDDPKRNQFDVHKFLEKYKLGLPVALNFYITHEDIVSTTPAPARARSKKKHLKKKPGKAKNQTTTPETRDVERIYSDEEEEDDDDVELEVHHV